MAKDVFEGVQPLVSVAMPVYNAGKYLRYAVLSVVGQSFQNWELLIIDDGSTDRALLEIENIIDSRIRIYQDGHNRGLAVRLNEAMDMARGQYLARMDQDDISYPDRFLRQLSMLRNDPLLDLVAARMIVINENNKIAGHFPFAGSHGEICAKPWRGFYFPHPTWMGRLEWFRTHRYASPAPYFCEDQELLLRSYPDSVFATYDENLLGYRVKEKINLLKLRQTRFAVLRIQCKNFQNTHQFDFMLLALLVYLSRIMSDYFRLATRKICCASSVNIDVEVHKKWRAVLKQLADLDQLYESAAKTSYLIQRA